MSSMNIIMHFQRMIRQIKMQSTGNPDDFANRLDMSERKNFIYPEILIVLKVIATNSKICQRYLYDKEGSINLWLENNRPGIDKLNSMMILFTRSSIFIIVTNHAIMPNYGRMSIIIFQLTTFTKLLWQVHVSCHDTHPNR